MKSGITNVAQRSNKMTGNIEHALKSARETRSLIIGQNILQRTPEVFAEQFPAQKAIIIADEITYKVAGQAVSDFFRNKGIKQESPFVFSDTALCAEYSKMQQIETVLLQTNAIPVAVGSGTINDLTKFASYRAGRQYFCVATAASMDGYSSFGASITYRGSKQTFNCPAPQAILADIDIIRNAPLELTIAGYADLFAKITAGADWILADELGVEAIDATAWSIVQNGLKKTLSKPDDVRAGNIEAISSLIEGLMMSGFAMQWLQSSRPASGAEHYLSHLWDMEQHTHNGKTPSHGFKVGIATLYISKMYELFLNYPVEQLNIEKCCAQWLSIEQMEAHVKELFSGMNFLEMALIETRSKYIAKEELAKQLETLKVKWTVVKKRLNEQLLPSVEVQRLLQSVGAPVEPEKIGITDTRLHDSFLKAQYIRRRFTFLDIAARTRFHHFCR